MKRAVLIVLVMLAVIGYAKAVINPSVEPVNRYFEHTGKYYTMEYFR